MSTAATPGRALPLLLSVTDGAFLFYWAASALDAVGWVRLPSSWMYSHHDDPRVVAWNWSFFPLDLAFSVTGLLAVRAARRGDALWAPLAIISLTLTMTAGGMAVTYWALQREFDPVWFGANLALLLWPSVFLWRLVGEQRNLKRDG